MNYVEIQKLLLKLYYEFKNKINESENALFMAKRTLRDTPKVKGVSYDNVGGSASRSTKSAYQVKQEQVFALEDDLRVLRKRFKGIDNDFNIKTKLEELNPKEQNLIYLHFGLAKTTREMSEMYDCSHVHIKNEIDKAIEKMVEYGI